MGAMDARNCLHPGLAGRVVGLCLITQERLTAWKALPVGPGVSGGRLGSPASFQWPASLSVMDWLLRSCTD